MKHLILLFYVVFFVVGIICCVVACNVLFKASELEFSAQKAHTNVIEVSDTCKVDTCKKCH